jgi:nicotinamidase-related amidase
MSANPGAKAVVVVDMQEAHVAEAHAGAAVVERIARLVERARAAGVPVVHVQHDGAAGEQTEPGTPGWELVPALRPAAGEPVLRKHSADAFLETSLEELLRDRGVATIVLCGYATDYCVASTARSALGRGFDVELVGDGHTTVADRAEIGDGLRAEEVVRHHNAVLASIAYPDGQVVVTRAEVVDLP